MTPQVISLSAAGSTAWIPVDYKQNPFNISLAVVLSNTPNLTCKVEYTLDDVFNTSITPTVFPVLGLSSVTTNSSFYITTPVRAIRLTISSWTSGTATLTALQGGVDSTGWQSQEEILKTHSAEHAAMKDPGFNSTLSDNYYAGTVFFGDGSGDVTGNALRPQDHIVVTPLVGASLTSALPKTDAYGNYYEIIATGAGGSSSGYIEFEIGFDQQQFQADRVTLSAEFDPVNVMSVACYLGVLSNYTVNANQSLAIAAGTNGAFNGRMSLEFRSDNWTKVGFATALETQNFKRIRFYFVLRQSQNVTIKIREARFGMGARKGRLAIMADDYFHSFLRRAVPILTQRGLVSSLAIIPASIGAFSAAATLSELQQYVAGGNECVVHGPTTGTNWFAAPYNTTADRLQDACYARDYILANKLGTTKAANCVAYPQGVWQSGSYETTFIDALKNNGFLLGRSTGTAGPNGRYFQKRFMRSDTHAIFTLPTIGHSYAGAAFASGDVTETANIATILGYVQAIAQQGIDGILVFHSIVDDGGANQTYQCELPRLIALADGVKAQVDAGLLEVVKISAFA